MGFLANLFTKGAGDAIKGTLEGAGGLAKDIRSAITGNIDPTKKAELETKALELEAQISDAMNKVNLAEAQNARFFVAGARPFVIWICGIALAYQFLVAPILMQIAKLPMPELDMGPLMTLLFGMLGLAGMRTYEKSKGVQGNH